MTLKCAACNRPIGLGEGDCDEDSPLACALWQRDEAIRERDEARAKLAEARDCGQEGVCLLSPGCCRHWGERNRELVKERDEARAELASLKASIDAEIAAMGDRVLRLESERDELATLCAAALCARGQADRDRAEAIAELRYVRAELNDFDRSLRATVGDLDKARAERDEARAEVARLRIGAAGQGART